LSPLKPGLAPSLLLKLLLSHVLAGKRHLTRFCAPKTAGSVKLLKTGHYRQFGRLSGLVDSSGNPAQNKAEQFQTPIRLKGEPLYFQ
jgi:hypothetical protein